jgi:hypothetical protein
MVSKTRKSYATHTSRVLNIMGSRSLKGKNGFIIVLGVWR